MKVENGALLLGRRLEFFRSTSGIELGYSAEQQDTFAVHYPKNYAENKKYPLYVVFHSAGHDIYSTLSCVLFPGNHDIYHTPDDMFGLFLDCRANSDTDWWWGGINAVGEGDPERAKTIQPVEHRCIATVEWVISNFNIDSDRVYAVGNSMGGSGALGVALPRGDIFAAIKVNVPAGVRHAADRCFLDIDAPDGFTIHDPPVVVDYSAQNDVWSTGHEVLYKNMREKKYALHGYWGEFGHENNNAKIAEYNDLVHAIPVFDVKLSEAYPVFTNADSDDKNPWEHKDDCDAAGQVNGFFRYENITDTKDQFTMRLWILSSSEISTRVSLPEKATAELLLRRVQNFKLAAGDDFKWSLTDEKDGTVTCGTSKADKSGRPSIDRITITNRAQTLTLTK